MEINIPNQSTFTKNEVTALLKKHLDGQFMEIAQTVHDTRSALNFGGEITLMQLAEAQSPEEVKEIATMSANKTVDAIKILNKGLAAIKETKIDVIQIQKVIDSLCKTINIVSRACNAKNEVENLEILCPSNAFFAVMQNIMTNSMQANPSTHMHFSSQKTKEHLHIIITDTSGGIPPEKFKQENNEGEHGLGLKIIQDYIKRCSGEITFSDIKKDEEIIGTKHQLTFPLSMLV